MTIQRRIKSGNLHRSTITTITLVSIGILSGCSGEASEEAPTLTIGRSHQALTIAPEVSSVDYVDDSGTVTVRVTTCDWVHSTRTVTPNGTFDDAEVCCQLDEDYVMVGGGAEIEGESDPGAFLRMSFPNPDPCGPGMVDETSWRAASASHVQGEPHRLRAYVIGLKLEGLSAEELTASRGQPIDSTPAASVDPIASVKAVIRHPHIRRLIGGGAEVVGPEERRLLTESYPEDQKWVATARENQGVPVDGAVKTYYIGMEPCPAGWDGCLNIDEFQVTGNASSGYGSVTAAAPGLVASIGGRALSSGGPGRFLHDMIPYPNGAPGFTIRSNDHGGTDTGQTVGYAKVISRVSNDLVARHSGKCLDVSGVSQSQGATLQQWSCHGGLNQRVYLLSEGDGYYSVKFRHSGQCLDVNGASTADGAALIQWPCSGADNQLFERVPASGGGFALRAKHSQKCIDIESVSQSNGASLIQWPCSGAANQTFDLDRFQATLTETANWGTGYCADLTLHNRSSAQTTGWSVELNLRGAQIYTSWNANYSKFTDTVTVTPSEPWNTNIPGRSSNTTIGFCATEYEIDFGGSMPIMQPFDVATVLKSTASY